MSINQKRIAILLPDLRIGGAERVAINIANCLSERGYCVDMVLMTARKELTSELLPTVNIVDMGVSRLRHVFRPLRRYLKDVQPEVVLANMWPLTVIALLTRLLGNFNTRVVIAEHTTWSKALLEMSLFKRTLARISMRFLFPLADSIVTVSNGAGDDLAVVAGLDRSKISVIYNPIVGESKNSFLANLDPSDWWNAKNGRILSVGHLKEVKDFRTLLSAFALLKESTDVKLLILGEGECRADLENLVRDLGVSDSVFMPGAKLDIAPYYQHASLFALSSRLEGFGNVIVEALAGGCPVVSTDCPFGPSEILVNGKYGRLVPLNNPVALSKAMFDSLENPPDTDFLKMRAQDFTINRSVDRYLEILLPNRLSKFGEM